MSPPAPESPTPRAPDSDRDHLSRIETRWTTVYQAHAGDTDDETVRAQARLLERYQGAIHRYLLAVTRDPDRASDIAQEFALKVLRGGLRSVDPRLGRFRDFLKRAVVNMLRDDQRRAARSRVEVGTPEGVEASVAPDDRFVVEHDAAFTRSWREELVGKAWDDLLAFQRKFDHPYHTVLKLRTDREDLRSAELAAELSKTLGREVDANWVRQNVFRARQHFTRMLLDRVAATLGPRVEDDIEDELIALDLHEYCRKELPDYLASRREGGQGRRRRT